MLNTIFIMLGSLVVGALVLLGIGGVAYQMFRDDGLISQALGALWEAQYQTPAITIILVIAAIFVFRYLYIAKIGNKRESRIPDLVLFAFIAAGIFFFGRLMMFGHI